LYVALTRAADHLILSGGLDAPGRPHSQWMKLVAQRFDLQTGLPKVDPYFGSTLKGPGSEAIPAIRAHLTIPKRASGTTRKTKLASLARFREIVEAGESGALPPLMRPLPPSRGPAPQISVSAIEQADEYLRSLDDGRLIFADPLKANDDEGNDDPTILGTVIHNIIDLLPWSFPANGEPAAAASSERLAAIVKAALRGLSPSQARRVSAETAVRRVEALVQSKLWKELTAARRWMREIDFLLPWPLDSAHGKERAIVSGQIDCLLQNAKGNWKIIDYKTGSVPAADPAALFDHFSIQLILYAQAVRAMTGQLPDSIEIVALHESIHRFPLTLWKESLGSVTRRVDAAVELLTSGKGAKLRAQAAMSVG
jgi:ATP-dependent helicase/nuclease subunit A